jgi:hypothetical protein
LLTAGAVNGTANTGGGGGGGIWYWVDPNAQPWFSFANGGSGLVAIRYPSTQRIINFISPGLTYTYSDDGIWKRYIFTAGTGNITF